MQKPKKAKASKSCDCKMKSEKPLPKLKVKSAWQRKPELGNAKKGRTKQED